MSDSMKKRIPSSVVVLGIVSLLTDTATEMIYPLVPVFVGALGSGAVMLGIIEGIAETTASLLKLVSGVISDRLGKRKILVLAGYSLSSLVRPLTGLVGAAWQIVIVRMFDRVGKGIRTAPRDALIASSVDESIRGKAFGFHRAMDHAGAVLGPVISIIILLVLFEGLRIRDPLEALRWTFIIAIIPGIITILIIIFFVREPSSIKKGSSSFSLSLRKFDRNFISFLCIMVLFTLGNSSDMFLLFRINESIQKSGALLNLVRETEPLNSMISRFGPIEEQIKIVNILFLPFLWGFFHVIKVIFSTPLGAMSDRVGRKKVIAMGWAVYSAVYLAFAVMNFFPAWMQIPASFVLFGVYAFFYAFSEGAEKALVADLVPEESRGSAFGLYSFATGITALPASVIFGFLYSTFDSFSPGYGGTVAFGFGASLALVSMLLLAFFVKKPGN